MSKDIVIAETRWATSAGNFLPFTNLPQRYAGKTVALCIVGEDIEPEPANTDLFGVEID